MWEALEVLLALVAVWFLAVPVVLTGVLLTAPNRNRYSVLALGYELRHPWFWFVTRRNRRLESHVRTIIAIMSLDGVTISEPSIRRAVSWVRTEPVWAIYFSHHRLIICSDRTAALQDMLRFWIIGHEIGHHVDHATGRRGHPLFHIIGHMRTEDFASAFAWYCLEYCLAESENRPFDWDRFAEKLPGLMEDTPKNPDTVPQTV